MMEISSLIRLENRRLTVDVFPDGGGKLVSVYNKDLAYELLWRNVGLKLTTYPPGSAYDPLFYGGIDELLPNDIPETVNGLDFPDHGELWTTVLQPTVTDTGHLQLQGLLPVSKLRYEKTVRLDGELPMVVMDYRLTNENHLPVTFLWKLHAALNIYPGDRIVCPAEKGQVVDPHYSRFKSRAPFGWPIIDGVDVSVMPPKGDGMDFFYLSGLAQGEVSWHRPSTNAYFGYRFDRAVFPFVWLFASYGGFLGHYTAILEPCTSMPISVNEAAASGHAVVLGPGESLTTQVTIVAAKQ